MPVSSQGFLCHWLPSFCLADLEGKLRNCSTNVLVKLQAVTKRSPNTVAQVCSNVISLLLLIHRGHKTIRGRKLVSSNPLWDPTFLHQDQLLLVFFKKKKLLMLFSKTSSEPSSLGDLRSLLSTGITRGQLPSVDTQYTLPYSAR